MIHSKNISLSYTEFDNLDELSREDHDLVLVARNTALNAYAPYSKFRVGAAIRLTSGKIVCGANVENAAFPSGICAERSAIANLVSNYPNDKPVTIAIAAMTEEGITNEAVSPCGNCRQVIAEEEMRTGRKIKIILSGKSKTLLIDSIGTLLPLQFNKTNLNLL